MDWKATSARVGSALSDTVAVPPDPPEGLPKGVYALPPELYGDVAVSQSYSGWGRLPASAYPDAQRFVLLRCFVGKQREGAGLRNAVCLQYRVWRRLGNSRPERIFELQEALPLFEGPHLEIGRRLT